MDCPTQQFHRLIAQALNTAVKNNIKQFNQRATVGDWKVTLCVDFDTRKDVEQMSNDVEQIPNGAKQCRTVQESVQNGVRHNTCQLDILELMRLQTGFISGSKILQALEDKGLFHGESTVKHALANLVATLFLRLGPNGRGYQIT
jgi:hypothetical protein